MVADHLREPPATGGIKNLLDYARALQAFSISICLVNLFFMLLTLLFLLWNRLGLGLSSSPPSSSRNDEPLWAAL
eukprot:CAMPEP_0183769692 /NCGR_PEP_ID=MMETSP0739-20130205/22833_1 /TAXON_ID=385413 /ORGANISM="Thalassiosira miniscula, Strain CCMP1093" /LENGTH=74 /DNA_ID=CAMNT_0026009375 /DNA_START=76 /DNA_END=296 /DNA_ORIENTATION=+